jgi:hypothetical protein
MNARELAFKLTKQWQRWCDAGVYISTDDGLVNLADIDYNEDENKFVMIPEASGLVE